MSFADKILITIAGPSGKVGHWVHVPLASSSADPAAFTSLSSHPNADGGALLPRTDLTATTVLGGTKREDEVLGQTLATTVASAILVKRPGEERLLVMGLGVGGMEGMGREGFEELVGGVLRVL